MKKVSTFYIAVYLMIGLTVDTPFVSYAQQVDKKTEATTTSKQETNADTKMIATVKGVAERDVKADFRNHERLSWFTLGLGCNACGFAAAYFADAQPPVDRLLGKSPDYVNFYVDTYESELQKNRMIYAGAGCVLSLGIILALISNDSSDSSSINTASHNSEDASLEEVVHGCVSILDLLDFSLNCLTGDCLVGDCLAGSDCLY